MADLLASIPHALAAKLDELAAAHDELAGRLHDPDVLADHRQVRDLSIRKAAIEPVVEGYRRVVALEREIDELRAASEDDHELAALAREEIPRLEEQAADELERVKSRLVHAEDRAIGSVILEIRAGTGGDEAGLWARDLVAMYERFAARKGWACEVMDAAGDAMGQVRHAVMSLRGEGVFSELHQEAGVHSVKRVPATESQGRIHTSTATVAVLPEPEAVDVRIDWANDVVEHITTSQGPGGQNVNKVATAVHLVHEPTGVEVRMQESKSQHQNREKARRLLIARVHDIQRREQEAQRGQARREQIGQAARSEKIRVYRYQEGIVVDQRVQERFNKDAILAGDMQPLIDALLEQETADRLAAL